MKKRFFRKFRTNKKSKKYKAKHFAIFFVAIFIVGVFLFGGKIQSNAEGKLVAKGNFYFNGGAYDLEKAAKYFKLAAFVDRKVSYPHYQLARVLFMKTDYKNGLAEIDRALVLNPENKRAFYIRGLIDGYAGNLDAAADDFQKFITWAPKEWAGYNDLAWVYYQQKDYQNAVDAAQKGLGVVPNNAWLLNGLGVSLEGLGRNDEAKTVLDQAASISKNLTAADWKRAYPGNNAESAPWDLAQFKTDVNQNLGLASVNDILSNRGKFVAACASSCDSSGYTCTDDPVCDLHNTSGLYDPITCSTHKTCAFDLDCCTPNWTPTCAPANCNVIHGYSVYCNASIAEAQIPGNCFQTYVSEWNRIVFGGGGWCVVQTDGCGHTTWANVGACPTPPSCILAFNPPSKTMNENSTDSTSVSIVATGNCQTVSLSPQDSTKATVTPPSLPLNGTSALITLTTKEVSSPNPTINIIAHSNVVGSADAVLPLTIIDSPPPVGTSCQCGNVSGICNGVWPSNTSGFCATGNVVLGPSSTLYGTWTWSCNANASCNTSTPVNSCSAPGKGHCGWIETNP